MQQAPVRRRGGARVAPRKRKSRRSRQPAVILCLAVLVAALLVVKFQLFGKEETAAKGPTPPDNPEWITQELLPVNEYSRPGVPLDAVNGVVVHYVGNPGTTAEQNRSYFNGLAQSGETYASSHFVIGLDGEIVQCVPLDEVAYCSNGRNSDTIAIECCHPDDTGEFSTATYDSLVKLVRWLSDYYGLDTSQILRHYDVTGKECPRSFVQHPEEWENFLAALAQ